MKTVTITFSAIETSGTQYFTNFYWNGVEFIKNVKAKVNADHLEHHMAAAIEWMKINAPIVLFRDQPFQVI